MFKRHAMAIAIGSVTLFSGCAGTPPVAGLDIEPVLSVRGGVDAEAQYRIGRYYQGQVRLEAAEKSFLKALALDPYHAEAHNALGTVYFGLGRIRKAEEEFKRAISIAPARAHLHNNLGYLYQQIGRTEEAVSAYREAFRLDPENVRIRNNLAALSCEDKGECMAAGAGPLAAALQPGVRPAPPLGESVPTAQMAPTSPGAVPVPASAAAPVAQEPAPVLAPAAVVVSEVAQTAPVVPSPSMAPTVQLANVGPNVWELRPIDTKAAQVSSVPLIPLASSPQPQARDLSVQPVRTAAGRVEVANGNGVRGLAKRVGSYLREQGYAAPRLTNHQTFAQRRTEIQYVAGAEALAHQIEQSFGQPARLVLVVSLERQAPVRVVLGKDFNESTVIARGRKSTGDMVALGQPSRQSK
ncbi:hypothetical protein GCM10027343_22130 [Noviherbaspirillum agri]